MTTLTLQSLLTLMGQKNASDLFLSPGAPANIKVNGTCVAINSQALASHDPMTLLTEMVAEADLSVLRETGELNCGLRTPDLGNFRISAMRQRNGYAVVIRAIPSTVPSIEKLRLPATIEQLALLTRGLVLVVGSTGAGKSTTVAAMLERRNEKKSGHILTVEDPVEYMFTSKRAVFNQREIGLDSASFGVALANGLRQAPDVIFIGEIRDASAMGQALAYAQTGQLCISTLHAGNAKQTLNRMVNFFPPDVRAGIRNDIAQTLTAIVAQRLVRSPNGDRVPVIEILMNTAYIADLIQKDDFDAVENAIEESLTDGCQTFDEDFVRLVRSGDVSREVALDNADSPNNLRRKLDAMF